MALPGMTGMGGFPGGGPAGAGMEPQQLQEQQMIKFVSLWTSHLLLTAQPPPYLQIFT